MGKGGKEEGSLASHDLMVVNYLILSVFPSVSATSLVNVVCFVRIFFACLHLSLIRFVVLSECEGEIMGYSAPAAIFFVLAAVATLATHYHYVKVSYKKIPLVTHCFIVLSVFICILPFPLLILDVDNALTAVDASQEGWFRPMWYTIMGFTQVMAWILLPVAQEYDNCGEFTPGRRLSRAIKENVKMYIIMGVVIGLLFAYIVFLKGLNNITDIIQLGVAAANSFGLLLIIIFLASGLVGIPKMLWKSSDPEMELRRHFYNAPDIQEDLDLAAMDLAEIKAELVCIDPRVSDEDRPYLAMMLDQISEADRDVPLYHTRSSQVKLMNPIEGSDVSTVHLEQLNAKLKRSIKVATRMNYLWESSVRHCKLLDKVIHGQGASKRASTRLWIQVRNPFMKVLSVCAFLLTVLVLWSELILPFQSVSSVTLSFIEVVMQSRIHFIGSTVFLFYMATCSYWATFQFKVFELFHILPSVSDAASLCFTATFLTRLLMPLCYNFLMIGGLVDSTSKVQYSAVFGSMDVGQVLGQWFNRYLPVFIPVVALLIQTKVFNRVLLLIGVDWHDPNDMTCDTVVQKIHDGRRLIMTAAGRELVAVRSHHGSVPSTDASSGTATAAAAPPVSSAPASSDEKGKRYKEYLAKKAAAAENAA